MKSVPLTIRMVVVALTLTACAQTPPDPVTITIDMTEYAFTPNEIELQVGQEVTFVLVNSGEQDHELMIGREVHVDAGMPNGYDVDFWHIGGVMPSVEGTGQLMQHEENHGEVEEPAGEHDEHDMGAMTSPEDEAPLMVFIPQGAETTTLTFTVTKDMVGEWEMGCFELNGVHYTAGMLGTLTVIP